jgi:hypothetical protein
MRKHFISQNCFLYFFINTIIVSWRLVIWRHRLEKLHSKNCRRDTSKVIYNIERLYDDWKYEPNASHHSNNSNNNGNSMIYVDSDSNTYNSSVNSVFIDGKRRKSQLCYNTFAGLYWLVNPKTQTPLQRPNEFKMVRKQLTQLQLLIITKP